MPGAFGRFVSGFSSGDLPWLSFGSPNSQWVVVRVQGGITLGLEGGELGADF
jgi:hypothetical protein